jgi:hypothetical protein
MSKRTEPQTQSASAKGLLAMHSKLASKPANQDDDFFPAAANAGKNASTSELQFEEF